MERTGHRSASLVDFYYDKSENNKDIMATLINTESDNEDMEYEDDNFNEDDS